MSALCYKRKSTGANCVCLLAKVFASSKVLKSRSHCSNGTLICRKHAAVARLKREENFYVADFKLFPEKFNLCFRCAGKSFANLSSERFYVLSLNYSFNIKFQVGIFEMEHKVVIFRSLLKCAKNFHNASAEICCFNKTSMT